MIINIKKHLLIVYLLSLIISVIFGFSNLASIQDSTFYKLSPDILTTMQFFSFIAPFFLLGGLLNGYYIMFSWSNNKNFNGKAILIPILSIFLFPFISMIGILLLLPLLIIDICQLLFNHNTYIISFQDGNIIQGKKRDNTIDELVSDMRCRSLIHQYIKAYKQRKTIIVIILLCFSLFFIYLLSDISFVNGVHMQVSFFSSILLIIIFFLESLIFSLVILSFVRRAIKNIDYLLSEECDPYRYLIILDYLIDHKYVVLNLGAYYILPALQALDNKSRIKKYLNRKNPYLTNSNYFIIYEYASLNEEAQKDAFDTFYEKDKQIIEEAASRLPIEEKEKFITPLLLDLESKKAMHQEKWQDAIDLLQLISYCTPLQDVKNTFALGQCEMALHHYDQAKAAFIKVIENGNTTCYVEKARAYLEQIPL